MKYYNDDVRVITGHYPNGRIALSLIDYNDGTPVATATINVPELPLRPSRVFIKDYSENEGVLTTLVEAGIVRPIEYMRVGYTTMSMCLIIDDCIHTRANELRDMGLITQ